MYAHIMDYVPFLFTGSAKYQFVVHTISSMLIIMFILNRMVCISIVARFTAKVFFVSVRLCNGRRGHISLHMLYNNYVLYNLISYVLRIWLVMYMHVSHET